MYKPLYILILLLIIGTTNSNAQNLVFNGDFEIFDTCPTNFSQPGDLQIEHATGWYAPTGGTSDYFNSCNTNNVGIPVNVFGFQTAFDGNGYCGFFANQDLLTQLQCLNGSFVSYGREYIQTKLITPLAANKKYKMVFYVSLADTVGGYAAKNIGVLLSDSIGFNCFKPIIASPQIMSSDFIIDNVNWTKVEGEFIANGGEQYLTIGNFADTLNFNSDTFCVKPYTDWQDGTGLAYYYIDGVSVEETGGIETVISIPNVFTPNTDGSNDLFQLNFNFERTEIFNRWGQKVFESQNNGAYWDGTTTSGSIVPEGTYYYIIQTKEDIYKGFIQLLR